MVEPYQSRDYWQLIRLHARYRRQQLAAERTALRSTGELSDRALRDALTYGDEAVRIADELRRRAPRRQHDREERLQDR